MSKKLTLYLLLGTVAFIAVMFYKVISPFVFPLLFGAVLTVLFQPLNDRLIKRFKGKRRLAAGATTFIIMLLFILPLGGALVMGGLELMDASQMVLEAVENPDDSELQKKFEAAQNSFIGEGIQKVNDRLTPEQREKVRASGLQFLENAAKQFSGKTISLVGSAIGFIIGFFIMMLSLFYFLADGDKMIEQVRQFSPLDKREEDDLIDQFEKLCRGVIMGTVLSALAQAVLAGIGFGIAGVPNVFLLMMITMVCAFIPFLGAGLVCTSVSIYLAIEGRYVAAGVLMAYSLSCVSTIDNVIKAYIIGESVRLNPLVVLITVIGAIQLIGLWGIFVGPMVAAFFFAFLHILHARLQEDNEEAHTKTLSHEGNNE